MQKKTAKKLLASKMKTKQTYDCRTIHCLEREFAITKCMPNGTEVVFGIGLVKNIYKGERADWVVVSMGNTIKRYILCSNLRTRKQLSLLRIGEYCDVYGDTCVYYEPTTFKKYFVIKARCIRGWYVPKMVDIRTAEEEENISSSYKRDEQLERIGEDILSQFDK